LKILVDPKYNPDLQGSITSSTALGPGITCAKFLGTVGSRTQWEKLYDDTYKKPVDRKQVARNLVPHAHAIMSVLANSEFGQHRLSVTEGIYEPYSRYETAEQNVGSELQARSIAASFSGATWGKGKDGYVVRITNYAGEIAGGINQLRRSGRAVVYQLIDKNGKSDPRKSFDLAVFWKDYLDYDKLTLDYDTYDPNGDLTCSLILEMPEVPESYDVSYSYDLETTFNGELQAKNELLEILPE